MTMTMEETETTTALTLTEQREAARERVTEAPVVTGTTFNVPAGYRVLEDPVHTTAPDRSLFLVTEIVEEGQFDTAVDVLTAALMGIAIPDVRPSTDGTHWFAPGRAAGAGTYLRGAFVRGAWVKRGATILPLEDALLCFADGTIARWHTSDNRHRRPEGFSLELVQSSSGEPATGGTGLNFQGRDWVLVEAVDRDEPETSLQPAPVELAQYPNECSAASPMLGLADSTNPVLNPDPEPGCEYVAWSKEWTPGHASALMQCCRRGGETVLFRGGTYRGSQDGPVSTSTPWSAELSVDGLREAYQWVKAAPSPAVHPEGPVDPEISSRLELMTERKGTYSDALNQLAEEQDWCSEYESVVQPLGYPGRAEEAKDYAVTLSVTFAMEDDGPSAWMDRRVETEIFHDNVSSLSLNQMTFSGTLNFTMSVYGIKPARGSESLDSRISAAISDYLDDTKIEGALEDLLSGSFTVSEWSIDSYDEDDD